MGHRWMAVPMTALLCLCLAGCKAGASQAEELALGIRGEYVAMTGCSAQTTLCADYGQRVYTYGAALAYVREGESTLRLTAPESVAGVQVRFGGRDGKETALEFDGARLETGMLSPQGLSPVDALPALLNAAREGFMAECCLEELGERETVHVSCRAPETPAGTGTEYQLWFDAESHALLRGEISSDGFTVIRCDVSDFKFT